MAILLNMVFVLKLRHYKVDGLSLKYEYENLGIFTTYEKAKSFAKEGKYYALERVDVIISDVELNKAVAF